MAAKERSSPDRETAKDNWLEVKKFLNHNGTDSQVSLPSSPTQCHFRSSIKGDSISTFSTGCVYRSPKEARAAIANHERAFQQSSTPSMPKQVSLVTPNISTPKITKRKCNKFHRNITQVQTSLSEDDEQNNIQPENNMNLIESVFHCNATPQFTRNKPKSTWSIKYLISSKFVVFTLFMILSFEHTSPPLPQQKNVLQPKNLQERSNKNPIFHQALNRTVQPLNKRSGFVIVKQEGVSLVVAAILFTGLGIGCL